MTDDRELFDEVRATPQPQAPLRDIRQRAQHIRRRRRIVPMLAGALLVAILAAVSVLTLASDDGRELQTVDQSPTTLASPTSGTSSSPPTSSPPTTVAQPSIVFEATMHERGGRRLLDVRITSDPAAGVARWAVDVNGHVVAHIDPAIGTADDVEVTEFGQPIGVTILAEDTNGQLVSESERAVVNL